MAATEVQKAKVLKALDIYAESGSMTDAATAVGLAGSYLYRVFQEYPELDQRYRAIQRARADRMLDESYRISTDETDPRLAHARATIRMNLAKMMAPHRYSDKLQIEVSAKPSLAAALDRKFKAIVLPSCDPAQQVQAQDAEFMALPAPRATDKVSVERPVTYASLFDD